MLVKTPTSKYKSYLARWHWTVKNSLISRSKWSPQPPSLSHINPVPAFTPNFLKEPFSYYIFLNNQVFNVTLPS